MTRQTFCQSNYQEWIVSWKIWSVEKLEKLPVRTKPNYITPSIVWRKENMQKYNRKILTKCYNDSLLKDEKGLSSIRQTQELSPWQQWETFWEKQKMLHFLLTGLSIQNWRRKKKVQILRKSTLFPDPDRLCSPPWSRLLALGVFKPSCSTPFPLFLRLVSVYRPFQLYFIQKTLSIIPLFSAAFLQLIST